MAEHKGRLFFDKCRIIFPTYSCFQVMETFLSTSTFSKVFWEFFVFLEIEVSVRSDVFAEMSFATFGQIALTLCRIFFLGARYWNFGTFSNGIQTDDFVHHSYLSNQSLATQAASSCLIEGHQLEFCRYGSTIKSSWIHPVRYNW